MWQAKVSNVQMSIFHLFLICLLWQHNQSFNNQKRLTRRCCKKWCTIWQTQKHVSKQLTLLFSAESIDLPPPKGCPKKSQSSRKWSNSWATSFSLMHNKTVLFLYTKQCVLQMWTGWIILWSDVFSSFFPKMINLIDVGLRSKFEGMHFNMHWLIRWILPSNQE